MPRTSGLPMPKNAPPRWASASSTTVSPSSRTVTGPTARTPSSQSPVASGMNAPAMWAPNPVASMPSTGGWSQNHDSRLAAIVAEPPASSVSATLNSPRTVGRYLVIDPPGSNVTSSPRASIASSGPRP